MLYVCSPAVISDYIPRGLQVPTRAGVLGLSVLTALGLTKLALGGEIELAGQEDPGSARRSLD